MSLTLFDEAGHATPEAVRAPAARRSDPRTSHDAAASMRTAATEQCARVLTALQDLGEAGATAIARRCGLTQVQVCRRLPELEAAQQVAVVMDGDLPRRTKTSSGRGERVWRAA